VSDTAEASDLTLLSQHFDHGGVTLARHAVAHQAATAGLAGTRLADFVLAVNELVTNAVRHAGGRGRLVLSRYDGVLRCEVSDRGPGIPADRENGAEMPPAFATGGRGLWLVRHICDRVEIHTGPHGTTVRVEIGVTRQPSP
jgi:anti-sigma regulatory factor (Ser/Thr protein kinase)